jgi:hypothetical protein
VRLAGCEPEVYSAIGAEIGSIDKPILAQSDLLLDSSVCSLQDTVYNVDSEQEPRVGMRADLDVYVVDCPRFLNNTYILRYVVDQLVRQGMSVRLLDRLDPASEATTAFVHIDLTTVPAPFTWVNGFYARCRSAAAWINRDD